MAKPIGNRPLVLRYILLAIGWLSVVLGVMGIFLPVLPTTPSCCWRPLVSAAVRRVSITGWLSIHGSARGSATTSTATASRSRARSTPLA